MHFLAAPLLGGLVLAGIPILIHLLNRRRFTLVEWAPMKYLKLTIKNNRRRLRIEQIILLILRTLVIVVLFLAVARPILSEGGGLLASRARVSRLIAIDDSLSMGYQNGSGTDHRSAFDSAKDAAQQVLRAIGAQDNVTAVLTSSPSAPLVREASMQNPDQLLARIDALQPTEAATRWANTFKSLDDLLNASTFPEKELVLITDLRRSGWGSDVTPIADRWAAAGVHVRIIDVGSRATDNVVLSRLDQEDAISLPNAPLRLRATIRNDTASTLSGLQAQLSAGDDQRPLLLPDLPAGRSTDIPLTITPTRPGSLAIRLALPPDNLPGDNTRWLAVNVRPRLDLLLIDGQPGAGPFESATDFLHVAYTIGADPWHVQRLDDADWQSTRTPAADVAVLANVASISPAHVKGLEKLVSDGMGLMIFAGEQVDPQQYNDSLYQNGKGLLPVKLDRVIDDPTSGLVVEGYADSPLSTLGKIAPAALARIKPKRFLGVIPPPASAPQVRVLARWNDAEAHAAVIEKQLGRGKILLWTISADRQWSDWPIDPTYVLAMRSAAQSIARPDANTDNLICGQPIDLAVDGAVLNPRITTPQSQAPQSIPNLRFIQTSRAGAYTFGWKDALGKDQSHLLCASPDPAESNLEPIGDDELTLLLGGCHPSILHFTHAGPSIAEPGREIWRTLLTALLVLAAAETAMAVWVGRER
jgi:hypothetical protein